MKVIYDVFDRSAERGLFPPARVRARCDRASSVRSGRPCGPRRARRRVLSRGRRRYFRGDREEGAWRKTSALPAFLGAEAATLPQLALRLCVAPADVSTAIPGTRRPEHVRANAAASDGTALSGELLEKLRAQSWDQSCYEEEAGSVPGSPR